MQKIEKSLICKIESAQWTYNLKKNLEQNLFIKKWGMKEKSKKFEQIHEHDSFFVV